MTYLFKKTPSLYLLNTRSNGVIYALLEPLNDHAFQATVVPTA